MPWANYVSLHRDRGRDGSLRGRGVVDDQQAAIACLSPEFQPFRVIHMRLAGRLGHCFDALRSDAAGILRQSWLGTGLDIVRLQRRAEHRNPAADLEGLRDRPFTDHVDRSR